MKKEKMISSLKSIGFALLYIFIFFLNSQLVNLFFNYIARSPASGFIDKLKSTIAFDMLLVTGIPILCYLFIFKLRKINIWKHCKFMYISLKNITACLTIGIAISLFILFFIQLFTDAPMLTDVKIFFSQFDKGSIFSYLFLIFIVYTFFEEILFRGLLYNELRKVFPFTAAVILQAIPASIQPDAGLVFFTFASMVIYCLAYSWTNSLWSSIIILYTTHSFVMLTRRAGIMNWLQSCNNEVLLAVIIVSLGITAVALYYLWKNNHAVEYRNH